MKYIRHRSNSLEVVAVAVAQQYAGVEFDLTNNGVTHEHGSFVGLGLERYLNLVWAGFCAVGIEPVFVLNVKEYGLCGVILGVLEVVKFSSGQLFVFDVPGPELQEYLSSGLQVLGRCSQYESQLLAAPSGVLVDDFTASDVGLGVLLERHLGGYPASSIFVIGADLRKPGGGGYSEALLDRVGYVITKEKPAL